MSQKDEILLCGGHDCHVWFLVDCEGMGSVG